MGLPKNIATRYPCVRGLVSGTTTQVGNVENLIAEQGSIVTEKEKVGL
jgi:hypothetical protein